MRDKGFEYGKSWLEGVEKVSMPPNLKKSKHRVAVMIDLVEGKIKVYDSLQIATNARQAMEKLAPIGHV